MRNAKIGEHVYSGSLFNFLESKGRECDTITIVSPVPVSVGYPIGTGWTNSDTLPRVEMQVWHRNVIGGEIIWTRAR